MSVSVIIPVYNNWALTKACLVSLAEHSIGHKLEVLVVDNASTDATPSACPDLGANLFGKNFCYLRQPVNRNFSAACNIGARAAKESLLFFLNNDTILTPDWLPPLLAALEGENLSKRPSAVGPLLLYPSYAGRPDRVQHLGLVFGPLLHPKHFYEYFPAAHPVCQKLRRYQALTAAALLLPKTIFWEAGGFDEGFINGGEDVALGLKLNAAGHVLTVEPKSRVYHLASQTPGIHAHAEHNARHLKATCLSLIAPDLHFFAEKDGYNLSLTPTLRLYMDLPERRKALLERQVERARSVEELEALVEREPLCHAAYPKLAALHGMAGNAQAAADTLFLAVKLCPHTDLIKQLAKAAAEAGDDDKARFAADSLDQHDDLGILAGRVEAARQVCALASRVPDLEGLGKPFEAWLSEKGHQRQSLDLTRLPGFALSMEQELYSLVDAAWYAEKYAVPEAEAFLHFALSMNKGELRDPNAFFDSAWYMKTNNYDATQYAHPVLHYLAHAYDLRIDPSDRFFTSSYLDYHIDVYESRSNPLAHYIKHGRHEGRKFKHTLYNPVDIMKMDAALRRFRKGDKGSAIVVYTAISGGYEKLLPPVKPIDGARYVCFSDTPQPTYGVWDILPLPRVFADPTRSSRYCKLHPHILFPEAEFALWIDGNIVMRGDMEPYMKKLAESGAPVGMIPHPDRESVYDEADLCIAKNIDDAALLHRQIAQYRAEGVPTGFGMYETGFMITTLRHEDTATFYNCWWNTLSAHSRRDQISLVHVLHILGIRPCELFAKGTSVRNSEDFYIIIPHRLSHDITIPKCCTEDIALPRQAGHFSEIRTEALGALPDVRAEVIVPVHNALEDTKECLTSVLPTLRRQDRLLVINDLSNAETTEYLRSFTAAQGQTRLVENKQNLGYTRSANTGLRTAQADFLILLNSDTVVAANWIEKLILGAYRDDTTGACGPLSNAAGPQSIPFNRDSAGQTAINELPEGMLPSTLDTLCESWSPVEAYPTLPLLHGFCHGIRRELIESIGYFDDILFPRFYGEENDYYMRAASAGFTLRVALNTYVYHKKSKSIPDAVRLAEMAKASDVLRNRHGAASVMKASSDLANNLHLAYMREMCLRFAYHNNGAAK